MIWERDDSVSRHSVLRIAVAAIASPLIILIALPLWGLAINLAQKHALLDSLVSDFWFSVGILIIAYIGMLLIQVPGYLLLLKYRKPVPIWASALLGVFVVSLIAVFYSVDQISLFLVILEIIRAVIGGVFGIIARANSQTDPHLA